MNPVLPSQYFIPDVEARVWDDGRLYFYGSMDENGREDYCSESYHVFSTEDLRAWKDEGESFCAAAIPWAKSNILYAPDCIYKNGNYYLYFCMEDNTEGVAVSQSPSGPFENPVRIKGADGDAIDPAIFVDDDGACYLFWGQFHLRGARLHENMCEILPDTLNDSILTEVDHGFHEGASIRKIGDIYYLIYTDTSRGKASCFGYATARSPLGPYEKRGIIIDNDGCDPATWNNHGSICNYKHKWYVCYHRASKAGKFNRRVCMEPITILEDGTIPEVEMTTQGTEPPLDAGKWLEAWRACLLSGGCYIDRDTSRKEYQECLTNMSSGSWAAFKYLNFSDEKQHVKIWVKGKGSISIRLDSADGQEIAVIRVLSKEWGLLETEMAPTAGVHAVFLCTEDVQESVSCRALCFV